MVCLYVNLAMSRKGKKNIDELAWQWTDNFDSTIGETEIQSSYRLLLPKCNNLHQKNCLGNPCCLHGLGQSIWTKSCLENESIAEKFLIDFNKERRANGEMVGLKNLGATCYVNTYLQLWFNNLDFRKAIYDLNEVFDLTENNLPTSIYGHLQLIFGLLQCSIAKTVDPSSFIKSLGLPTDLQQDAQEFSKLFMCMLETTPGLASIIEEQFSGNYVYITKCLNCHSITETVSKFYELDLNIQGHKDLESCISEFLKPEQLQNENQYFCESCLSKQNAIRQIILKKLPPTLNIQLLRFVFDRTSQRKCKLNNNIIFPEKLDFSKFFSANDVCKTGCSLEYNLTAVLLHRGYTASSGHFVAHIFDWASNSWFQFNDETVVRKCGRKLNFEFDVNTEDTLHCKVVQEPIAKKPKLSKGNYSSKCVYMLVYSNKSSNNKTNVMPPSKVMKWVEKENANFEINLMEKLAKAKSDYKSELDKKVKMKEFIKSLMSDSKKREWVPTNVLKHFLHNGNIFDVFVDWNKFLCKHGKLSLNKLNSFKYISTSAADILYENNSEFIRLTNSMCNRCVYQRCMLLQKKKKLAEDKIVVSEAIKEFEKKKCLDNSKCYFVGRLSFRQWNQQVLHNLLHTYQMETVDEIEISKLSDVDNQFMFNADILCSHNNLTADFAKVQIVPEIVWAIFYKYFPESRVYKVDSSVKCAECVSEAKLNEETLQLLKVEAKMQKNTLNHLYLNKNRPKLFKKDENENFIATEKFFVVNADFVEDWRNFVRQPSKDKSLLCVQNKYFICEHNKLLYDLVNLPNSPEVSKCLLNHQPLSPPFVLLWPKEWEYIVEKFNVDFVICIKKYIANSCKVIMKKLDKNIPFHLGSEEIQQNYKDFQKPLAYIKSEVFKTDDDSSSSSTTDFITIPELCIKCIKAFQIKKEKEMLDYNNAEIFISKSSKTVADMLKDNSFTDTLISENRRRSRRCVRNEKKLSNISSALTLKQLKVKIMALFSVPPFDQNLWFNGVFLNNDEATLRSLNITPGSSLVLIEDVPDFSDLSNVFEVNEQTGPEIGFLGTNLIGNKDS